MALAPHAEDKKAQEMKKAGKFNVGIPKSASIKRAEKALENKK